LKATIAHRDRPTIGVCYETKHIDFGQYHTYSWLKVDAGNPLWVDRTQRDVDAELTAKVGLGDAAVVDIFDAHNKKLICGSTSDRTLSDKPRQEREETQRFRSVHIQAFPAGPRRASSTRRGVERKHFNRAAVDLTKGLSSDYG
jgi:hypothetical protein